MLEAVIIGRGRSTPGLFSMRRRIRRLRRFSWRWTLAFTRKPPGAERTRHVKYPDCSPKPGGFRASQLRSAWGYAWLRTSSNRLPLSRETTVDRVNLSALTPSPIVATGATLTTPAGTPGPFIVATIQVPGGSAEGLTAKAY